MQKVLLLKINLSKKLNVKYFNVIHINGVLISKFQYRCKKMDLSTVFVVYINTMKPTFDFNFLFSLSFVRSQNFNKLVLTSTTVFHLYSSLSFSFFPSFAVYFIFILLFLFPFFPSFAVYFIFIPLVLSSFFHL